MANSTRGGGFIPRYDLVGGISPAKERVVSLAAYATAIYVGDPVKLGAAGQTVTGLPAVELAAAGDSIYGIVTAVIPDRYDSVPYKAASTLRTLEIETSREMLYEIEEDGLGAAVTVAEIGNVADIINPGTGSTRTGLSACKLDSSTAAAGSSAQVIIKALVQRPDNELSSTVGTAYNKWIVGINERQLPLGDAVNGA